MDKRSLRELLEIHFEEFQCFLAVITHRVTVRCVPTGKNPFHSVVTSRSVECLNLCRENLKQKT